MSAALVSEIYFMDMYCIPRTRRGPRRIVGQNSFINLHIWQPWPTAADLLILPYSRERNRFNRMQNIFLEDAPLILEKECWYSYSTLIYITPNFFFKKMLDFRWSAEFLEHLKPFNSSLKQQIYRHFDNKINNLWQKNWSLVDNLVFTGWYGWDVLVSI